LQANAAQKKLAASNAATLQTHRYAVLIINALFIVIRLVLRRSSSTLSLYIMYTLTFALAAWLQLQLESVGRPKFDSKGIVLSSGSDLGQAGLTEYMFDVLYLTWGIQLLVACTTTWAWWLYLVVRSFWRCALMGRYRRMRG
jgi:SRP-independent targeting protein 2/TMEM208